MFREGIKGFLVLRQVYFGFELDGAASGGLERCKEIRCDASACGHASKTAQNYGAVVSSLFFCLFASLSLAHSHKHTPAETHTHLYALRLSFYLCVFVSPFVCQFALERKTSHPHKLSMLTP